MRTTLTLDPDVAALVRAAMRDRGQGLKQVVNEALRAALTTPRSDSEEPFPTYSMGRPVVPLVKALQLAGALEDEELLHRLARGS
jgi:hypothetical protein